ncbi:hypothetical protein QOZ80_1BG0096000 [Eleusine coracana subsp. coracana]|nr:hypothetical protein QOZ80_1BG0096000 [Eleusine coracana subsp. coracana]
MAVGDCDEALWNTDNRSLALLSQITFCALYILHSSYRATTTLNNFAKAKTWDAGEGSVHFAFNGDSQVLNLQRARPIAMSEGVEMIAGAVVKHVAGILSKKAWERIELMWNFKEDAQEMENKMIDMKVALNYADKCSRGTDNAMVQHWLKKYKLSAYDIEDTLDELEADEMIWKNSQCTVNFFFTSINPLVVRLTMSNKMRNIMVNLDKIAEDQKKLPLLPLPTPTDQENIGKWRETFIGDRDEIEMIGREREKKHILIKVFQKHGDQESSIVPVVGLGGIDHDCLIRQWIALGFIQDSDGQPLQNIGREYVDKFLGMSFLTVLNSPTVPAARILKPTLKLRSLVEDADAMADKLVLEKLVPPRNLQHFDLWGYMDTDFPRWMLDIPYYLPNLITILSDLKGCNHIPPLGQLPNLRALTMAEMPNIKSVGREFYGDHGSCQKLRMIILESMDNLEEWWTTRSSNEEEEFLIPNLHVLSASDCPKLKFLPYPPRSMTWGVQNSDHVLPEHGFGNLSCVTSPFALAIMGASSSEVWRRAAQCIPSIEHLYLDTITGLRTLPGDIQCFTSLRTLSIEDCGDLETLPEWLGDLISLREFRTSRCQKLSALPESIQRLTELKKLQILDCLALSEKCQGEDRHKITHIPEVIFE